MANDADTLLTAIEAARFVGAKDKSTIRKAENRGLKSIRGADGVDRYRVGDLLALEWRGKAPPEQVREKIIAAARAREEQSRAAPPRTSRSAKLQAKEPD